MKSDIHVKRDSFASVRYSEGLNFCQSSFPLQRIERYGILATSVGKLIFHIFGVLAEFEQDIIREPTNAGLTAAHARGRKGGRPRAFLSDDRRL
jgi:DNA invertase Pin-like site-specific DNA recombinase